MSIFTTENIDFTKEPLFFGSGRNVARLDLNIEQWIQKRTDKALGLMWFKNDFSYNQDAKDFDAMPKGLQELFLKNLKFQTVLDSIATRTVLEVFKPITTNPHLESWWTVHGFFEDIHSNAYAEIIKALPVNATKIFDDIIINPHILDRATMIISKFNDTVKLNAMRELSTLDYNLEAHKKSLVLSLYALNILEAGLFQTSFITTFAFAENGMMESSCKALSKISIDEQEHKVMTQYLINRLKKDDEWRHIFETNKEEIRAMYRTALEADMIWIDYLFDGDAKLLGLNANILKEYARYNLYKAATAIGLNLVVDEVKMNPCAWATKYTNIGNLQVALNEADGVNYLLGSLNKAISEDDWASFKVQT